MNFQEPFTKIGLIVIRDSKLLLVRKKNSNHLILPGGKVESDESEIECLNRELFEELQVHPVNSSLKPYHTFVGQTAEERNREIRMKTYFGEIDGTPSPSSEIDSFFWCPLSESHADASPLLSTQIIPCLIEDRMIEHRP